MKISVCIPMYNEEAIIEDTARQVSDYMERNFEDYEVIFSSDGSTDRCAEIVRDMNLSRVRVIENHPNRGKGYAVRMAVLESTGDVVIFTDADLAYGVEVIGRIKEEFEKNTETQVLVGSRNISKDGYDGYTFIRRLASKVYIKVLCMMGGLKLSDSQCGCKAFSGKVAHEIFSRCEVDRFAFDFECILWAEKFGIKICEMPVKVINHRQSSVHVFSDSFKMIRDVRKMKRRIRKEKI